MLFPYAFSHSLTTPVNRDVFTTLPEVRVQMIVLANYILNTLKQTKVAAIYQNDDFGQDAVAGLDERFGKDKVPLVKLPFDRGTTNFSGVVAQAKAAGVEHVVFLGIPKDAALVMREANNLGWKPQFSGHNALGDPQTFKLAGPLVEGAIAIAVMEPLDSDKPAVKAFIAAQQKYKPNTSPTTYSMHGYQSGKLFAEVLKRSGGKTDEASIVGALESMKRLRHRPDGAIDLLSNPACRRTGGRDHEGRGRQVEDHLRLARGELSGGNPDACHRRRKNRSPRCLARRRCGGARAGTA